MHGRKSSQPLMILITGASGAGKTTVLKEIEKQLLNKDISINFFDIIDVPNLEDMVKNYGSPEAWQKQATELWMQRLAKIQDKKLIFLEGQFNPDFALEPLRQLKIQNYLLFCLHASQNIREYRLHNLRNQPELADVHMNNWAEVLKAKTLQNGGIVISSDDNDAKTLAKNIINIILTKYDEQKKNITLNF